MDLTDSIKLALVIPKEPAFTGSYYRAYHIGHITPFIPGIGYFRVPSHNVDSDSSQRVQYRRVRPEETGFYQGFRKRA